MTDAQLEGLARQAANIVRAELEQGRFEDALLAVSYDGKLERMERVERFIREKEGKGWSSKPDAKARVFGIIRIASANHPAGLSPPDAYIFAGGCRVAGRTERGIYANAQTATRACIRLEPLDGGEPETFFCNQAETEGQQKMFGELPEELAEYAANLGLPKEE